MSLRLYVGNLPFTTTDQDLQDLFASAGQVASVHVVRDNATGRARGFAFVEMATDDEARKVIAEFHDREVGGRKLIVNEAKPRPERSGGFRDGGNRRREPRW